MKTRKNKIACNDMFYGLLPATNLRACEREIRALEKGEMLLVVQDLSKIVTKSFVFEMGGAVSATSREGQASVLLVVRDNDQVLALPFAMFAAFERDNLFEWTWEIPVALGSIEEKEIPFSARWLTEIPLKGPRVRVFIEPHLVEKLDTSEVITPDGERVGPAAPIKKYLEAKAAFIPKTLQASSNCVNRVRKNKPRVRQMA